MKLRNPSSSGERGERSERRLPLASALLDRWMVQEISVQPFGEGWWSFNPCVHHDPRTDAWLCLLRCANYSLPGGVPQLSREARRGRAQTRNVIATLDPATLRLDDVREVRELDGSPRAAACSSLGFEDVRLFRARAHDDLLGIATALQLNLEHPSVPEMVLVRFDRAGDIVEATPLRGPWNHRAQKNWAPFDGSPEPRFLYSIERGVVMDVEGPVVGSPLSSARAADEGSPPVQAGPGRSGVEVRSVVGGRRLPSPPTPSPPAPGSQELRGGSQLVEIEPGRWLGVAHEAKLLPPHRRKFYWHTLYTVDHDGVLLERSMPLKLATQDIEFVAGLAVDGRGGLAISFGTDDHQSWIGVTDLDSVERVLRPVRKRGLESGKRREDPGAPATGREASRG